MIRSLVTWLAKLRDVALSGSPASGQFLRHNGSAWANSAIQAADVPDLSETYLTPTGSGASLTGVVHTAGAETVGGAKTFSSSLLVQTGGTGGVYLTTGGTVSIPNTGSLSFVNSGDPTGASNTHATLVSSGVIRFDQGLGTGNGKLQCDGSLIVALNGSNLSSGTVATARGGTGQTTYTDGQLLIGNTATGGLTKATLTAGTNVTITNAGGSITIAATAGAGGYATIEEEGVAVATQTTLNFIGLAVTVANDAVNGRTNVTVSALVPANNLSDVGNAATARTNLGLAIGTDVLAPSGSGANLTGVVHTTGTETVGGAKTFSATITTNGNLTFSNAVANNPTISWVAPTNGQGLQFYSGASQVARFQDNGFCLFGSLGTIGGLNIGDWYIQRGGGPKLALGAAAGPAIVASADAQAYTSTFLSSAATTGTVAIVAKAAAGQSANLVEWQDSTGAYLSGVSENGYLTTRKTVAPADAELSNSEVAWWLDDTAGSPVVKFRGKDSAGTAFTASVGTSSGTVTSVSVAAANGFGGSVATATTTPAITITTSVTGLLKGDGTGVSAATAGADYYAPGSTDVAIADGGTGASTASAARTNLGLVIGTDVAPVASPTFNGTVTANTLVAAVRAAAINAATDGATVTFDLSLADTHTVTLGGNRTLALSNAPTSSPWRRFTILLKQDATGSRTVSWFSGISWAGGTAPTLTTTANKTDAFVFLQTGNGQYLGFVAGANL